MPAQCPTPHNSSRTSHSGKARDSSVLSAMAELAWVLRSIYRFSGRRLLRPSIACSRSILWSIQNQHEVSPPRCRPKWHSLLRRRPHRRPRPLGRLLPLRHLRPQSRPPPRLPSRLTASGLFQAAGYSLPAAPRGTFPTPPGSFKTRGANLMSMNPSSSRTLHADPNITPSSMSCLSCSSSLW